MVFEELKFYRDKHHHLRPQFGDMRPLPNKLGGVMLTVYSVFIFALLAYTATGLLGGELFVPARHGGGFFVRGPALKIMCAGLVCAACNLSAKILGHFLDRNFERIEVVMGRAAIIALLAAGLADAFIWRESSLFEI